MYQSSIKRGMTGLLLVLLSSLVSAEDGTSPAGKPATAESATTAAVASAVPAAEDCSSEAANSPVSCLTASVKSELKAGGDKSKIVSSKPPRRPDTAGQRRIMAGSGRT